MISLKEELTKYKEKTGKSVAQMAREMDYPIRTVQNWADGSNEPRGIRLTKVLEYLGVLDSQLSLDTISDSNEVALIFPDINPPKEKENTTIGISPEVDMKIEEVAERAGLTKKETICRMVNFAYCYIKFEPYKEAAE